MLPAAWGEREARRHIILYSILLVIVSVMPFLFRALGWMYLGGALLLGAYMLFLAARLWFVPEGFKPLAKKLYHYSNAYLALLFALMVADTILLHV
jgi:protoheme IX farnesyltransferase